MWQLIQRLVRARLYRSLQPKRLIVITVALSCVCIWLFRETSVRWRVRSAECNGIEQSLCLIMILSVVVIFICGQISGAACEDTSDEANHGSFWQLTDVHFDLNYSIYTKDPAVPMKKCQGKFGDYICDSPWSLVVSAIDAMKRINPKPDFILWTGDNIAHVDDKFIDEPKILNMMKNITQELTKAFDNVAIYPTIGNHDVWPNGQVPVSKNDPYYAHVLAQAGWETLLKANQSEEFKQGGYYSVDLGEHLKLVCINSNLWFSFDKLSLNTTDPTDQFQWLEVEMENVRKNKKRVILAGHVPPGVYGRGNTPWMHPIFNKRFHMFLQRHSDLITASIFGHEHTDALRIVYDIDGKPRMPIFLAPAITPWNNTFLPVGSNNPSVRLYKYNRNTGRIIDYTQYYLNLLETKEKADWQAEYKALETYDLPDLSAETLDKLAARFNDDPQLLQKYCLFNSVSNDKSPCNGKSKLYQICSITKIDFDDYQKCLDGDAGHRRVPSDDPHRHGHERKEIERLTYYLLGGLIIFIVILFFFLALCCCQRQRAVFVLGRTSRYSVVRTEP